MSNAMFAMGQAAAANTPFAGSWDLAYAYYDPETPWSVATANYAGSARSFYVGSQELSLQDVFFKPDGTKMYILGNSGDAVNEYNLTKPWDASTAAYVAVFSVSSQDLNPLGFFFKPDGTKMYVVGISNTRLYEYNLSTAWSISSASYSQMRSLSTEDVAPRDIFFKPDGTKMYVLGDAGDEVNEYNLSTAWNISTASYLQNFSVNAQENAPTGFSFKPDGTKMFVMGTTGDDINEYNLSTAWDISTATYQRVFSVAGQDTLPRGLFFKPDGRAFYIAGGANTSVQQYNIGGFSVSTQEASPYTLFFKPDGTKMFVMGTSGDDVNQYTLSTPWNVDTATYSGLFYIGGQETTPQSLFFKPDGTVMYVMGITGDDINQYTLSTPWDVTTATYQKIFSVAGQDTDPQSLFFKPDGTKMYIAGNAGDDINEYNLSTAWDVGTAVFQQLFSVAAQVTAPKALVFKPDGTKMFVHDSNTQKLYEYDLSTPWNVSTASYSNTSFNTGSQEPAPEGVFIREDGGKFFIVGTSNQRVYGYTMRSQE